MHGWRLNDFFSWQPYIKSSNVRFDNSASSRSAMNRQTWIGRASATLLMIFSSTTWNPRGVHALRFSYRSFRSSSKQSTGHLGRSAFGFSFDSLPQVFLTCGVCDAWPYIMFAISSRLYRCRNQLGWYVVYRNYWRLMLKYFNVGIISPTPQARCYQSPSITSSIFCHVSIMSLLGNMWRHISQLTASFAPSSAL